MKIAYEQFMVEQQGETNYGNAKIIYFFLLPSEKKMVEGHSKRNNIIPI